MPQPTFQTLIKEQDVKEIALIVTEELKKRGYQPKVLPEFSTFLQFVWIVGILDQTEGNHVLLAKSLDTIRTKFMSMVMDVISYRHEKWPQ